MAENVLKLKKQAVALGMSKDAAKKAGRPELEEFIANAEDDGDEDETPTPKATKKKKKAVVKSKKKKDTTKGENKKDKNVTRKKADKTTKAKAAKPKASKPKSDSGENLGRLNIGTLDWTAESDEWNPRKGGPVERLFKALKSSKGDVDKAFDKLESDMYEFVGKKKRNGDRRTKQEVQAMLRYRLNRTKFEFAKRTGQHESATDRAEYGTGQYATTRKKKASKPRSTKKAENTKKQNRKSTTSKKSSKKRSKK